MADLKTRGDGPDTGADTDAGAAPGSAPPAPPRGPGVPAGSGRPRWRVVMAALAVVVLALTTLDVVLLVAGQDTTAKQRGPALDVARHVVLDLSRSHPDDRDARLEALRGATTGPLRAQLDSYAPLLRGQPEGRTVDAEIGVSALERIDEHRAVALVTVTTSEVTAEMIADPTAGPPAEQAGRASPTVHHRLAVELVREDGTWKAESVRFVP